MQSPSPAAPAAPPRRDPAGLVRAHRFLWFTFAWLLGSVTLGLGWDRRWHATHVFDTFFSPPHLFTYTMTAGAMGLILFITLGPGLRPWFGAGVRMPGLRLVVPGALALTLGGFGILGLAGLLDSGWHTTFGLDETGWSAPHAMIGWGLFVVGLGFVACRLALRPGRPLHWYTALILGLLILQFSATPFLGPLHTNATPESVHAVARLPVLRQQPPAEHTYRIYAAWNLTRENPLLILLGAVWAGALLALLRALDRRPAIWLGSVTLWSAFSLVDARGTARALDGLLGAGGGAAGGLATHPANWLPLPLLPAALVLALLLRAGWGERRACGVAGGVFGAGVFLAWGQTPWEAPLVLLAMPALIAGAALGGRIYQALDRPDGRRVGGLLLAGLAVPLATGVVDLVLRHITP